MQDRIVELLSYGLSQNQVSQAVGCDESYISQLLNEPAFRDKLTAKKLERAQAAVSIDRIIEVGEEKALQKLVNGLDFPMKQSDALRTFEVLNKAKRHTQGVGADQAPTSQVVVLALPQIAQVFFKMNPQNEIVEVDGRQMQALPGKNVERMLQMREEAKVLLDKPVDIPEGSTFEKQLFDL